MQNEWQMKWKMIWKLGLYVVYRDYGVRVPKQLITYVMISFLNVLEIYLRHPISYLCKESKSRMKAKSVRPLGLERAVGIWII